MSLIASVLRLDRTAIRALRVTDPYSVHRVVYSFFEDLRDLEAKAVGRPSGILYADCGGDFRGRKILMLSDRAPVERVEGAYGQVHSKLIRETFLEYGQYRFQVTINPTRCEKTSGKRLPIIGRSAITKWFCDRAEGWGFHTLATHVEIGQVRVLQFKSKDGLPITIAQADIRGQLEVTNLTKFRNRFSTGIGRGKAFGCGLLRIAPIIDNPFA